MQSIPWSRRNFLLSASAATLGLPALWAQQPGSRFDVELPQTHGPGQQDEEAPAPSLPPGERVGYAIVGLGRLTIDEILPAFAACKYSRPVALVSGHRNKAEKLAAQYNIPGSGLYSYETYDRLADNPEVKAIYIVLPNSMHEEYTVRGAKAGKHILCEKPMANSAKEAERMIAACRHASRLLMIAYRQQYEPNNRALLELVSAGKLGKLRAFVATNSQRQGDPSQWRLIKALAGGGSLPDIGLYCLNASRFLSGEEPAEVTAQLWQPKDDPRFREVECSVNFSLRFPSGLQASCSTSYDIHKSQYLRLEGTEAWAEMSPAFAYHGNKLRYSLLEDGKEVQLAPQIEEKNQFAAEIDHFSRCMLENMQPHTPGEEGLQDHKVMEAIYEAAALGRAVKIAPPSAPTRGPAPKL